MLFKGNPRFLEPVPNGMHVLKMHCKHLKKRFLVSYTLADACFKRTGQAGNLRIGNAIKP